MKAKTKVYLGLFLVLSLFVITNFVCETTSERYDDPPDDPGNGATPGRGDFCSTDPINEVFIDTTINEPIVTTSPIHFV
ncbi:MAG: hypothetical protein U9O98_07995 [Asgard group archaeon]|nr:hypothetical protein [Asgard group archaeon]